MADNSDQVFGSLTANPFVLAVQRLNELGQSVQIDERIPGLFKIDNGPELTATQFLRVACSS